MRLSEWTCARVTSCSAAADASSSSSKLLWGGGAEMPDGCGCDSEVGRKSTDGCRCDGADAVPGPCDGVVALAPGSTAETSMYCLRCRSSHSVRVPSDSYPWRIQILSLAKMERFLEDSRERIDVRMSLSKLKNRSTEPVFGQIAKIISASCSSGDGGPLRLHFRHISAGSMPFCYIKIAASQ